jgi:hypothetical protein
MGRKFRSYLRIAARRAGILPFAPKSQLPPSTRHQAKALSAVLELDGLE